MNSSAGRNINRSSILIPGAELLEEVGRGSQGVVFRARRENDIVAVKVCRDLNVQFKKEAVVMARIDHPVLPIVLEVGEAQSHPYLIMEYIDGQTLGQMISHKPLDENVILNFAISLTSGLVELHRRNLVHRDIKPNNILIESESGQPKLIDFGFAGLSQIEETSTQAIGTFLYSAPEQTGLLKRPIDGRTDLYALGATLFEAATGQPPYRATEAGELIRLHAVAPIPHPRDLNSNLSPLFSAIIERLLAKDPDDRYQTALSLLADLNNLSNLEPGHLGGQYARVSLAYEAPLVGREDQLYALNEALREVLEQKKLSVVLVEGAPGAGKSRLIRSLIETAQNQGMKVLGAKCSLSETAPLAMIRRMLDDYFQEVESNSNIESAVMAAQIREIVGDSISILQNFSPKLSKVLGSSTLPVTNIGQDQFHNALAQLLVGILRQSVSCAFFIDDIQWLDEGSRLVLKKCLSLLSQAQVSCLVACTTRNELENSTKVSEWLDAVSPWLSLQLDLPLLDEVAVSQLVSYQMGTRKFDSRLSHKLFELSQGSPFALGEYLQAMFDADCFTPLANQWQIDFQKLETLKLPQDVIHLVLKRIDFLTAEAQAVLSFAALCGSTLETRILAAVCELSASDIEVALAEAQTSFLIEPGQWGGYRFVHDRVREAFLAKTDQPEVRKALYRKIANRFAAATTSHRSVSEIYALAKFYSESEDPMLWQETYAANLDAGLKALRDFANEEARKYFLEAQQWSQKFGPAPDESLQSLYEALAAAYFRLALLPESFESYHHALELSDDPLKRAKLRCRMSMVQLTTQKVLPAASELKLAFAELNVQLPQTLWGKLFWSIIYGTAGLFSLTTKWTFGTAQGAKRERHRTLADLSSYSTQIYYYYNDVPGILFIALKSLYHVHRIGISPEYCSSYIFMGCLSGVLKLHRLLHFFSRNAILAAETISNPFLKAQASMMRAISVNFTGRVWESEKLSKQALLEFDRWLPVLEWLIGAGDYITTLLMRGYDREVIQWGLKAFERIESSGAEAELVRTHGAYPIIAGAYANLGDLKKAGEIFQDFRTRIESMPSEPYLWNTYLTTQMFFLLEQNDLGQRLDWTIEKHQSFQINPLTCLFHYRIVFVCQAYARLAQYEAASESEKPQRLEQLRSAHHELSLAANVPIYLGHRYLIQAALARIDRQAFKAHRLLERAGQVASQIGSPWLQFEILKQKALLANDAGQIADSQLQAQMAYRLAEDSGWKNRADRLGLQFGLSDFMIQMKTKDRNWEQSTLVMGNGLGDGITYQRHREALMQLGLALSKTLDPDEQIRVALTEIVKLLSGERAFLFLTDADENLVLKLGIDSNGARLEHLTGFSQTVVHKVQSAQEPIIVSGTDDGEALGSESVVAHNLRSILAVPLFMKGTLIGVVYLDNRMAKGIFSSSDVEILISLANHIAISIETSKTAQLMMEKKALAMDLEIAGTVQSLILPKTDGFESEKLLAKSFYRSATQTGGDWWFYHSTPTDHTVLVGDITGHGAGSAMVSAVALSIYRTLVREKPNTTVPEMMLALHEGLIDLVRGHYWMTLMALQISTDGRKLRGWSAGAPQVYIIDQNGEVEILLEPSRPIGGNEFSLGFFERELKPKARVFIFTDGVIEQQPLNGQPWGERQLVKLLKHTRALPTEAARNQIASELMEMRNGQAPEDDMTFLIIDS